MLQLEFTIVVYLNVMRGHLVILVTVTQQICNVIQAYWNFCVKIVQIEVGSDKLEGPK